MSETRIDKLTTFQVQALREVLTDEQAATVDIHKTYAVFRMDRAAAHTMVNAAKDAAALKFGGKGHPVASLHGIIRKLSPVN